MRKGDVKQNDGQWIFSDLNDAGGTILLSPPVINFGERKILNFKKMKKIFFIFGYLFVFSLIIFSCTKNIDSNENSDSKLNYRNDSLNDYYNANGNFKLSKLEFINLSDSIKKELWLNKIEFSKTQDLNDEQIAQLTLLETNIKALPNDTFYLTESIIKNGISLTRQFNEDAFKDLFNNLDLVIISKSVSTLCNSCIIDLQHELNNKDSISIDNMAKDLPNCNCRWTCSDPIGGCNDCQAGHYKGCCKPVKGCGFLLLQDCTGHDQPCAGLGVGIKINYDSLNNNSNNTNDNYFD